MSNQALRTVLRSYGGPPKLAAILAPTEKQLHVYACTLVNNSGGASNLGVFRSMNSVNRAAYRHVIGTGVTTDLTSNLDAAVAQAFFQNDNDVLLLASKIPSGLLGLNISSASGVGVYTYHYYNGSDWTAFTPVESFNFTATGNKYAVFPPAYDWSSGVKATDPFYADVDSNLYYIKITCTTKPTTPIQANALWVGEAIALRLSVGANGTLGFDIPGDENPLVLEQGEGIIPYFSSANANNSIEVSYKYGA